MGAVEDGMSPEKVAAPLDGYVRVSGVRGKSRLLSKTRNMKLDLPKRGAWLEPRALAR